MSKAKNKRACPAVGRVISAAECGENRASKYDCPADCPHNPWAPENYERALELEGEMTRLIIRAMNAEAERDPDLRREMDNASREPDENAMDEFIIRKLIAEPDESGRSRAERILATHGRELKNDGRFLLSRYAAMRPSLLEIHRVLDDEECEVVDLLEPGGGSFIVHDRGMAASVVRFTHILVRSFPMPHYWRTNGLALTMPELSGLTSVQILQKMAGHLGAPTETLEGIREWLNLHFHEFWNAVRALGLGMQRRMMETADANACAAWFRLKKDVPALESRLETLSCTGPAELTAGEESEGCALAFNWFGGPDDAGTRENPQPVGRTLLGRLVLAPDRVRLTATSIARYRTLREQFEERCGDMAAFDSERIEDFGAASAAKSADYDAGLFPEELLEKVARLQTSSSQISEALPAGLSQEEILKTIMRRHLEGWLDDSVPALGGLTPRAAMRDPAWRSAAIEMAKNAVRHHDERHFSGGGDDINWLLRELGLDELVFDPPPPRDEAQSRMDDLVETDDEEEDYDIAEPLPAGPISAHEVSRRMEALDEYFPDPDDELDSFDLAAPELSDAIGEMTEMTEKMTDNSAGVVYALAARAWFTVFAPGTRPARRFDRGSLSARLAEAVDDILSLEDSDEARIRFIKSSPQPWLNVQLCAGVIGAATTGRKNLRPAQEDVPAMLTMIKTVIAEIDRLAR